MISGCAHLLCLECLPEPVDGQATSCRECGSVADTALCMCVSRRCWMTSERKSGSFSPSSSLFLSPPLMPLRSILISTLIGNVFYDSPPFCALMLAWNLYSHVRYLYRTIICRSIFSVCTSILPFA